jgi:hypothetical protein
VARVEGFAHEALDEHPEMLARLLGYQQAPNSHANMPSRVIQGTP